MSSKNMHALGFYQPGEQSDAPSFDYVEIEKPEPTGRNLLVEVRAVAVNPTDLVTYRQKSDEDTSLTLLGRDVSGVVVEIGDDCSLFEVGDEVFYAGTSNVPGALSEFHLVDERIVGRKPANLSFSEAAALPLTSLTTMEALFDRMGISRNPLENEGKSILIIGAAGGVGSIATQIAGLIGLTVIGTASRAESTQWAKEHGVNHVINHRESFKPQLEELGIAGIHYIFCLTHVDEHMSSMAEVIMPQGKICSILPIQKPLSGLLFAKSVTFSYELMYTRSVFQTDDMIVQHQYLNELADWVEASVVQTTLNKHFSPINPKNLKEAYQLLMSGHTSGKIVLEGPFEG